MIQQMTAAAVLTLFALPAFSQELAPARDGFYRGTNEGKSNLQPGLDVTGKGQYAGYQFNRHLKAELGHHQLPDTALNNAPAALNNGQVADKDIKIDQTSLSLMARYPVTEKVDLYGRTGYNHTEYKSEDGRRTKLIEPVTGVGASYSVSPKADVRVETQRAKTSPAKVSVGAGLSF